MKYLSMKKIPLLAVLLVTCVACVTVNIYFPAAEIQKQAEEIVDEVYKDDKQEDKGKTGASSSLPRILSWIGPSAAHAADYTSVSNASIRGLKKEISSNHGKLRQHYDKGRVGINNKGYLEIRSTDRVSLPEVRKIRGLVSADNNARRRLYQEVAKAKNLPSDHIAKIERIYARLWRDKARGGWWVQEDNGEWRRK